MNGMTMETAVCALEAVISLVSTIVVSALLEWRMTLICIIATPLVVVGGYLMSKAQGQSELSKVSGSCSQSKAVLKDLIQNYRAVISLGQSNIDHIVESYKKLLQAPYEKRRA